MRLANLDGRATIVANDGLVDVAGASNGAFSASIDKCLGQLDKLDAWYRSAQPSLTQNVAIEEFALDPRLGPVVNPRQIFAIGLNYRNHAAETGAEVPNSPWCLLSSLRRSVGRTNHCRYPVPRRTTRRN